MCCILEQTFGCGHHEREYRKCDPQRYREKNRHRGFFSTLFNCAPRIPTDCRNPPRGKLQTSRDCRHCSNNAAQINNARHAHNQYEADRKAQRKISEKIKRFQCSRCKSERRSLRSTRTHAGLCCEFGEMQAQREGWFDPHPRNIPQYGLSEGLANPSRAAPAPPSTRRLATPAANYRSGKRQERPQLRITAKSSIEEARERARQAAEGYGWTRTRDSTALEPSLVQDFLLHGGPGVDIRSIPEPEQPQPRHWQLGIDLERWERNVTTGHGTYPGRSTPPPEKVLPPLPGRGSKHRTKERTHGYHKARAPSFSRLESHRFSYEISQPSSSTRISQASPVSPLSHSRFPEPAIALRSVASRLDDSIDDALNSVHNWGLEPLGGDVGLGPMPTRSFTRANYAPAPLNTRRGSRGGSKRRR